MDELARTIFALLRQMDAEAASVRDGHVTGLYWYGGHARPDLRKPQTEVEWSRRLSALLTGEGYPTQREQPYTTLPRKKCDLLVRSPAVGRVWIEVKGAFKCYWAEDGRMFIYRSYLLHPLVAGLDPKSHTVPLDMAKLGTLTPSDADAVAVLLIGFDADGNPMTGDLAELESLSGLGAAPWRRWSDDWRDPRRAGKTIRARMWARAVSDES